MGRRKRRSFTQEYKAELVRVAAVCADLWHKGVRKSGKPRAVPIHPALLPVLRQWRSDYQLADEGLVFPTKRGLQLQWLAGGRGGRRAPP